MLPLRPMAIIVIKTTLPVLRMALIIPLPTLMQIMASPRIVYHAMACPNPQPPIIYMIRMMQMLPVLMIVVAVKNVISLVH